MPFKWKDRDIALYMSCCHGRQPKRDGCLQWVNIKSNVHICSTSNLNYLTSQWKSFQRKAMFLPGISNVNAEYRRRNVVFHILIRLSLAIYWLNGAFTKFAKCMKMVSIFMLRTIYISLTLRYIIFVNMFVLSNICYEHGSVIRWSIFTDKWFDDWYLTM